jgi:glycine cleavage system H lipoate-binding protein
VISTPAALLDALKRDQSAVGFLRLADITDPSSQKFIPGIRVIPVDVNQNGISDYFEQFYSDFHSFSRGVYIGKYPKTLCNNIFAVSMSQPINEPVTAFLSYILTDGQPQVAMSGYTPLAEGEGRVRSAALVSEKNVVAVTSSGAEPLRAAIWIVAFIITLSVFTYIVYRFARQRNSSDVVPEVIRNEGFSEKTLVIPAGLLFDKSHTWAFMEKDGSVRVGIDDFLQHLTGSITRLRMKSPGEKVRKGDHIISLIQKGKQLEISSPVSGTIRAINEALVGNPSAINNAPYNEGWVYIIDPDNWLKESRIMNMAGRYTEWIRGEFTRMKDFIASLPGVNEVRLAHVVLQDGGELREGLMEEFGPEVWEEFQLRFIDSAK